MLEFVEVGIKVSLVNMAVAITDVVDEVAYFYTVESFSGIFKFSIIHLVDGIGSLIHRNATFVDASLPLLLCLVVEVF